MELVGAQREMQVSFTLKTYMEKIRKDNPSLSEKKFIEMETFLKACTQEAKASNKTVRKGDRAQFLEIYPDGSIEWLRVAISF